MILASASLLVLFLFPIWRITLIAPQFPEGLYMEIWVNKIGGSDEYVLQNINILNHYIGMQKIEPDAIPELKYFPYIIVFLSVTGFILAFVNKRKLFLAWSILLMLLGALALYDFWQWEYQYGHNLDPEAPIQVPGMSYQPPLLGSKMLLNFEAISWPATGFWFFLLAIIASFAAFFIKRRQLKKAAFLFFFLPLIVSCQPQVQEINFGNDQCAYCKMTITDQKYGAELVTEKGKAHKFDAVECLLFFMQEQSDQEFALKMAVAFNQPGQLFKVEDLHYLVSPQLNSPMGANISAFSNEEKAREFQQKYSGELYQWSELQEWFKEYAKNPENRIG